MLITVPKWKVEVTMPDGTILTFWVTDHSVSNVMRKMADIQFSENGLIQPTRITIG